MSDAYNIVSDQTNPDPKIYVDKLVKRKERLEKKVKKATSIRGKIERRRIVTSDPLERARQKQDIDQVKKDCEKFEKKIKKLEEKIKNFKINLTRQIDKMEQLVETGGWEEVLLDNDREELPSREAKYYALQRLNLLVEKTDLLIYGAEFSGVEFEPAIIKRYRARLAEGIRALDFMLEELALDRKKVKRLLEAINRAEDALNNSQ